MSGLTMRKVIIDLNRLFMASWNSWVISVDKSNVLLEEFVDFTPEAIQQAARDISDEGEPYPPTIGKIKQKALLNDNKHLSVSSLGAWSHILDKLKNPAVQLTGLEKAALAPIGDLFTLRQKSLSDLSFDRTVFVNAFEELRNMEIKKIVATPQVDNLLGGSDAKRLEGER